ncbi:MAG: 4-(cytidine 5'-diphospho)-2-C-methyl-D-erythritol kinase [Xanthomonadaceae bacterium]|nr:4-(cytidine 5'-diphospho)-2-C-methyl-D-erythritol kinase [Xanthomonadaceae bacterium]
MTEVPYGGQPWPAPAKLNLFLHITGRRPDGYHELQTLFQFLDHGDELRFHPAPAGRIELLRPLPGVPADQDLCLRAARLLREHTGVRAGVVIELDKRLPMGGGLGGGSSDAATVLVALNRIWETGLNTDQLAALGLRLGADVPVFVRGFAAWAEGVGERLTPATPPEPWYLVVVPSVSVSTAAIFSEPELTRDTPPITIADFLSGAVHNDCEPVVRRRFPAVDAVLAHLREHGLARMTGTGACVFLPLVDAAAAHALDAQLPPDWTRFIARGCNRSPLLARLAQGA